MTTTLGFLGCGNMGQALLQGILQGLSSATFTSSTSTAAPAAVWASTRTTDISHLPWVQQYQVKCTNDSRELAKHCDIIIVGVNFETCQTVLTSLKRDNLLKDKLLISIVTSISCDTLNSWKLGTSRIIRAMPNTPCQAREGLTALCTTTASPQDLKVAQNLFECVGRVVCIPERLLPGWTCAGGCGPAYVFLLLEALSDAIVAGGLPRDIANEMSCHITGSYAKSALLKGMILSNNNGKKEGSDDLSLSSCDGISAIHLAASSKLEELGYKGIGKTKDHVAVYIVYLDPFSVMAAVEAARNRDRYLEEHPDA